MEVKAGLGAEMWEHGMEGEVCQCSGHSLCCGSHTIQRLTALLGLKVHLGLKCICVHLATITAKIYYSDAGNTHQQQGEGLLRQSLEEARPGFPALPLPAGRCQQH